MPSGVAWKRCWVLVMAMAMVLVPSRQQRHSSVASAFVPPLGATQCKGVAAASRFPSLALAATAASPRRSSSGSGSGGNNSNKARTPTVIDEWTILPDGRVQGIVVPDGDQVVTSPLENRATAKERTVVRTVSGSQYRLERKAGAQRKMMMAAAPKSSSSAPSGTISVTDKSADDSGSAMLQAYLTNKARGAARVGSGGGGGGSTNRSGLPTQQQQEKQQEKGNDFLNPSVLGGVAVALGAAIGITTANSDGLGAGGGGGPAVMDAIRTINPTDIWTAGKEWIQTLPSSSSSTSTAPTSPGDDEKKTNPIGTTLFEGAAKAGSTVASMARVPSSLGTLGESLGGAVGNVVDGVLARATKPKAPASVGSGPYVVRLPYLEDKIAVAEQQQQQQQQQQAATGGAATADEEATARLQVLQERQAEAARREAAMEQERIQLQERPAEAEREEEAARAEALRLQQEADEATARERAAQEEFNRKLQEAEEAAAAQEEQQSLAIQEAAEAETFPQEEEARRAIERAQAQAQAQADLTAKVQDAEQAAVAQAQAEQEQATAAAAAAAAQQRVADAMAAKANIGPPTSSVAPSTSAAIPPPRGVASSSSGDSAYDQWQATQRATVARRAAAKEMRDAMPTVSRQQQATSTASSSSSLSAYERWQEAQRAKVLSSSSMNAASPTPIVNQIISGKGSAMSASSVPETVTANVAIIGGAVLLAGMGAVLQREDDPVLAAISTSSVPKVGAPPVPPPSPPQQQQLQPPRRTHLVTEKPEEETPPNTATWSPPSPAFTGSYLEAINNSGGIGSTTPNKRTYSPFKGGKPVVASSTSSNALYSPPSAVGAVTTSVTMAIPQPQSTKSEASSSAAPTGSGPQSYMEALGGVAPTAASARKPASYSPFRGSKPMAASMDSLYSAPATLQEPPSKRIEASLPVAPEGSGRQSYMTALGGGGFVAKKAASYSPFGGRKPISASSDSLYAAPTTPVEPSNVSTQQKGPQKEVGSGTATNGSYLEALSDSSTGASAVKASYSPFGKTKPVAASSSSSLYDPPPGAVQSAYTAGPGPSERDSATVSGPSYLDALSPVGSNGSSKPKSYSPFSSAKPVAPSSISNSLYAPPVSQTGPTSSVGDSSYAINGFADDTTNGEAKDGSYLEGLGGTISSTKKKSYSPFGSSKPQATTNDSLYSPPFTATSSSSFSGTSY